MMTPDSITVRPNEPYVMDMITRNDARLVFNALLYPFRTRCLRVRVIRLEGSPCLARSHYRTYSASNHVGINKYALVCCCSLTCSLGCNYPVKGWISAKVSISRAEIESSRYAQVHLRLRIVVCDGGLPSLPEI